MDSGHGTDSEDGSVRPNVGLTPDFDIATFGLGTRRGGVAHLHQREADGKGPTTLRLARLTHQHASAFVCWEEKDMGHRVSAISTLKVHLVTE